MTALARTLVTAASLLVLAGSALLPATPSAAVADNPCVAGPLEKAPTIAGDVSPNGRPVDETPLADGTYIPVVMVHGWTGRSVHNDDREGAFSDLIDLTANKSGTADVGRSLIGQVQDAGGTSVYTFDYHEASARWVTDAAIGPKLAEAITCLSALHGHPVVLMVHSMGGLAGRQALDLIQQSGQTNTVSDVVTFGTPNTGSWLASVVEGADTAAQLSLLLPGAAGASINAVRSMLVLCGTVTTSSMENTGVCGLISPQFWSARSAAGRALRIDSPEIRALAPWPDDVRVHALGGSIDLEIVRVGWFNLSFSAGNVNTGDFVVGVDSATHDATDSHVIECFYTMDARAAAEDNIAADWLKLKAANETRDNVYTNGAGSACAHGNLMRSIELTNDALGVIADVVDQANEESALCEERELRLARDGHDQGQPLILGDGADGYFYDTWTVHVCKSQWALVESSHSSGSVFTFWLLERDGEAWRIRAVGGTSLHDPEAPVFPDTVLDEAGLTAQTVIDVLGVRVTQSGRPLTDLG